MVAKGAAASCMLSTSGGLEELALLESVPWCSHLNQNPSSSQASPTPFLLVCWGACFTFSMFPAFGSGALLRPDPFSFIILIALDASARHFSFE